MMQRYNVSRLYGSVSPSRHGLLTSSFFLMIFIWSMSGAFAGADMNVAVGQAFNIELETNPSTGYTWNPVFQPEYLELKLRKIEPSAGKLLGAPVKERFTFMPLKAGICELEFRYSRSWESQSVKTENFRVHIRPQQGK